MKKNKKSILIIRWIEKNILGLPQKNIIHNEAMI